MNSPSAAVDAADPVLRPIAEFVSRLTFADLPERVVHDCKRRLVDAIGCGLGAYNARPCVIGRRIAMRVEVPRTRGARLLGTTHHTLPELAAFSNGALVRYLDGNDTYLDGGGHPSDVIPAVLAVADAVQASGKACITAIVAAYEVYHNVHFATLLRSQGWDHTLLTAIGSAMGAASIMGLSPAQTANAAAIAMTSNHALMVTRRGTLSEWRGCAGPYAARNGVFAAILAAEGLSGPGRPAVGTMGLMDHFGRFELSAFPQKGGDYAISKSHLKAFLCEYHAQGVVTAALELVPQINVDEIEAVQLHIYNPKGLSLTTRTPEKWHPQTRESADHSIPYILAATLVDGAFSDAIFDEQRLRDPAIYSLSERITISEDEAYSRRFPEASPCRIEIRGKSGHIKSAAVEYPRGHFQNPMIDSEIESKFYILASRVLSSDRSRHALTLLWTIDNANNLEGLMSALCIDG
jgi:2-methylcitrate dehydratase